ncbi:MAG TPA: aminotransferase class III-fold pyridoxal phosphate-dependent enzyme, partial [Candidatus Paceibacterota bacterium]|nr:aminotransferase class III-fold pyridoxal phosphate-dependent enzyme [Candidatus Paceibacterota bacterium]
MNQKLDLENLLGSHGSNLAATMRKGLQWLDDRSEPQLLRQVGQRVSDLPDFIPVTKHALQNSFGGNQTQAPDDLLVGRGLFYLTEQRRLCLDCTSGHYQMLWGYNHPDLCAAIAGAMQSGVVWDNHSNIPQAPAKQLAHQLVAVANSPDEPDPLDTVLLGVCTGSVACAAALKIQLKVYQRDRSSHGAPLIVVLDGNYHGTDMVPQFMRGLWPELVRHFEVIVLQPNDYEGLEQAFHRHGSRIAGFWAEPIMMNREAIALEADYLRQARHWCTETGALLCIDEIQTGFWLPEVFEFRALGIQPDLVVTGKGMTAGFHSLSAVLMKNRH